jgi:hypothetical protein
MTSAVGSERLERRYRRLLACYPIEYRALYGDEMIGVLMTASTPEQRHPDTREAFGLITTGLAARLRLTARATYSPAWRDATRAFGYLAAVMLAALYGYQTVASVADRYSGWSASPVSWTAAIAWILTAVAAGLGLRTLAAVTSIAGAAGVAFAVTRNYEESPWGVVASWWIPVLAVTTAVALVMLARPEGGHRHGADGPAHRGRAPAVARDPAPGHPAGAAGRDHGIRRGRDVQRLHRVVTAFRPARLPRSSTMDRAVLDTAPGLRVRRLADRPV